MTAVKRQPKIRGVMNTLETRWLRDWGYRYLSDRSIRSMKDIAYEAVRLRLPGGSHHTPDFSISFVSEPLTHVEIKAVRYYIGKKTGKRAKWTGPNYRETITKLKIAAEAYPDQRFYLFEYDAKEGWGFKLITVKDVK